MAERPSASPPDAAAGTHGKLEKALAGLPHVSEGTSYGYPCLKAGKKFLCRFKDAETLVVVCSVEEKELLIEAAPRIYFETEHYRNWPMVLVRIAEIDVRELRHRLRTAWLMQAPKKLAKDFLAGKA